MALFDSERPDGPHGWFVAVVGSVAMIFTFGTPLSYGILTDPFSAAFDVSPLVLSVVFGVMLFAFFFGSAVVGVFGVRFPARAVILACAATTALVAPSLYAVSSVVGLAVVFAAYGLALGTAFVLVASVVPRWFEKRRAAATGLIFAGNGLGLFILPPVWQFVLAEYGVRQGLLLVAGVNTVVFLAAGLVCRRPSWVERTSATAGDLVEWLADLGGSRQFQLLFVGVALSFGWYQLLAAYAVDLFVARGFGAGAASAVFGLVGGVSIVSRVGSGYMGDRVGVRRTFLASLICTTIGVGVLLVPATVTVYPAVALLGLGLGTTATLYIPLLMDIYATSLDSAVIGVFNVGGGVMAMAMPPLGTLTAAHFGGYAVPIAITGAMTALGAVLVARGTSGQ